MPSVVAPLSAAALPISGSAYGCPQPPCSKPPRRSSSGRPGAWMTPSRVRLMNTTILRIRASLTWRGIVPPLHPLHERVRAKSTRVAKRKAGPHRSRLSSFVLAHAVTRRARIANRIPTVIATRMAMIHADHRCEAEHPRTHEQNHGQDGRDELKSTCVPHGRVQQPAERDERTEYVQGGSGNRLPGLTKPDGSQKKHDAQADDDPILPAPPCSHGSNLLGTTSD